MVSFRKKPEQQVQITGLIGKLPADANHAYRDSRPEESRLGAITSPQSQVIENREWPDEKSKAIKKEC